MRNIILFLSGVMALIIILLISMNASAEVPPPPTSPEVVFALSHAGDNSTATLTGAVPFEKDRINGYIAISGTHVHDGSKGTDVANRLAYLETGFVVVEDIEFSVYGKILRNSERNFDRQWDLGYFLQHHVIDDKKLSWGVGNFTRNELPELQKLPRTSFNWSLFVRTQHEKFSCQYTLTAQTEFDDLEHTLTPSFTFKVRDNVSFDVDFVFKRADNMTYTSSMTGIKIEF